MPKINNLVFFKYSLGELQEIMSENFMEFMKGSNYQYINIIVSTTDQTFHGRASITEWYTSIELPTTDIHEIHEYPVWEEVRTKLVLPFFERTRFQEQEGYDNRFNSLDLE